MASSELGGLLTRLAIDFIHRSPGAVDSALRGALAEIGEAVGAVRGYVYDTGADRRQLLVSLDWHAAGVGPVPEWRRSVALNTVAWPMGRLIAGESAQVSVIQPVPEEASDGVPEQGEGVALLLPMRIDGRLIGVVGFDSPAGAVWSASTVERMRPFGDLCANARAAQRAIGGLEASELRHRSVLDEISDVVVRIRADGTLGYVNQAWTELTGKPVAEMIGADSLINIHPDDRMLALEHMTDALTGVPGGIRQVRFLDRHGGIRWMEARGRAVHDADGHLVGFSGVLHDVTERKESQDRESAARLEAERSRDEAERAREEAERAREQAERARDVAERASRAKSEFLSRMSHELRTPLNAILGFAQLLELSGLQDEDAESLSLIMRAGRHLLDLINDALDVSRIEVGRMSLSLEPVDVAEVARESIELVRPTAETRRVRLCISSAAGLAYVHADRQRLKQVLVNLLTNAVKYNNDGGEAVLTWTVREAEQDSEAGPTLRIEVTDTGIGVPAERLGDIFLPFERIGAEYTETEGSGLGLAVTKSLVEAMGGSIGVHSEPRLGSTFHVDLPEVEPAGSADGGAGGGLGGGEGSDPRAQTILYIEDNPSNATLMRRILAHRERTRLQVVADGLAGLAAARSERPDLVLLDLHLPGLEGAAVLEAIRADGDPAVRDVPVVILTADLTSGTERRLLQAGATAFLPKPVDIAVLLETVDSSLRSAVGAEPVAGSGNVR